MLKTRGESPDSTLVVDSGDLFFESMALEKNAQWALNKAQVLSRAYKHMKAVALNVGDLDLQALDFLKKEAEGGLPLISANLMDASTLKPLFTPYVVAEMPGLRVGFFGLLPSRLPPHVNQAISDKAFVRNPVETAKEMVTQLQGEVDIIVLLSDLGFDNERDLVAAVRGIHFVLGGHDGRLFKWPYRSGETFIVQSYKKGMYVGKLRLVVSEPTQPFHNPAEADQIKHDLRNMDQRIAAVLQAQKRNPDKKDRYEEIMKSIIQRKDRLQKQLTLTEESASNSNRFYWTAEPLRLDIPEDEDVLAWVKETGLTKD